MSTTDSVGAPTLTVLAVAFISTESGFSPLTSTATASQTTNIITSSARSRFSITNWAVLLPVTAKVGAVAEQTSVVRPAALLNDYVHLLAALRTVYEQLLL